MDILAGKNTGKRKSMERRKIKIFCLLILNLVYLITIFGELKSKKRLLFFFDKIEVTGNVDVYLTEGKRKHECTIYADSKIIDSVVTKVSQKTLFIDANNTFNFARRLPFIRLNAERKFPVEIIVSIGMLKDIRLLGQSNLTAEFIESNNLSLFMGSSGKLHIDKLFSEKTTLIHEGSGNIILKGDIDELHAKIYQTGSFWGDELEVSRATLIHQGTGLVHLKPLQWLDARMLNNGNVFLHSTPKNLVVDQRGNGKISDILPESPALYDLNQTKPSSRVLY